MTALSMFVLPNCIVMASDAVAYDDAGVVRQIHTKQVLAPELDCVISVSGSGPVCDLIKYHLGLKSPADFDGVIDLMPSIAREIYDYMLGNYETPTHFMALIGGWSKSKERYRGFYIATSNTEMMEYKAFDMQSYTSFSKPNPDTASLAREGIADIDAALNEMDIVSLAIRLMLAQRTSLMGLHGETDQKGYGVGGFCQITQLQQGAVNSMIALRWPDVIGEKIDPSRPAQFSPGLVVSSAAGQDSA